GPGDALEDLAARDPGAIVIRGRGRAFCAGADLHAVAADDSDAHAAWTARVADLHERIRAARVPVVAAVHGHALGAGLSLALACDFMLCADDAMLGLPEVEHGLVAGIATVYLRQLAGSRVALDLALSGRRITGAEAAALGIANRALPAAELEAATAELAQRLAAIHPGGQRLTKRLFYDTAGRPIGEQLASARDAVLAARRSAAAREGAAAFERRRRMAERDPA
ncbi:MAG: enoyl-CoA hydratase/isomerase family protein, partial [Solirubrobacteraceae bacterium]